MRDDDQGLRPADRRGEALTKTLWIQRREALVENRERCALQQRTREEDAAPLAMLQLPAGLAHLLLDPARHPRQQIPQTKLLA